MDHEDKTQKCNNWYCWECQEMMRVNNGVIDMSNITIWSKDGVRYRTPHSRLCRWRGRAMPEPKEVVHYLYL